MHVHPVPGSLAERQAKKKQLNGLILRSPMKGYRAMTELGTRIFADGALPKKQKELTALAVAIVSNCFD
jgi:alkylhydroperoxidase/carboxymuconolactone decarboxylase family protein YurZ